MAVFILQTLFLPLTRVYAEPFEEIVEQPAEISDETLVEEEEAIPEPEEEKPLPEEEVPEISETEPEPEGDEIAEEKKEEDKDPEPVAKEGIFELTFETDDAFFSLCSDSGLAFPFGSYLTVLPVTEEEEDPEISSLLQEVLNQEEAQVFLFDLSWMIPNEEFPEDDLCLSVFLSDTDVEGCEGSVWILEEEEFLLREDAEWDEGSFFITPARSGLIALSLTDPPSEEQTVPEEPVTEELPSEEVPLAESWKPESAVPEEPEAAKAVSPPEELTKNVRGIETDAKEENEQPLRSMAETEEPVPRTVYRFSVTAEDLDGTEADLVLAEILDKDSVVVQELTLSALSSWQASWETADPNPPYSIREKAVYDSSGHDISSAWDPDPQTDTTGPSEETVSEAEVRTAFDNGTYVIAFIDGENQYLLVPQNSDGDAVRIGQAYGWYLGVVAAQAINAPDEAKWAASTRNYGTALRNIVTGNNTYLAAVEKGKGAVFVDVRSESYEYKCNLENGFLKCSLLNDTFGYLQFHSGSIACTTSAAQATSVTLYRLVNYADTVYQTDCTIRHTLKPKLVSVKVNLQVSDTLGERNKEFPLSYRIDGGEEQSFTLTGGGEKLLKDVPIGSELRISLTAGDFQAESMFPGLETGDDTLIIPSLPEEGGTVTFTATRNVTLGTGIYLDDSSFFFPLLFAVFIACYTFPYLIKKLTRKGLINKRRIQTMLKKALSVFLVILVFLSIPAFACADAEGASIKVKYTGPEGFSIPNETPSLAVTAKTDPSNPGNEMISLGTPTADDGNNSYSVLITLPTYTKVGKYVYIITQNNGTAQGVTYDDKSIVFAVLAKYDGSEVATEYGILNNEDYEKKPDFTNICSYGSLSVTNVVSGSTGDVTKEFEVSVSFAIPDGNTTTFQNEITYVYGNNNTTGTITPTAGSRTVSVTIPLKHNETVTFSNVPSGVNYSVTQNTQSGYEAPSFTGETGMIGADPMTATVTNKSNLSLGQGIFLDNGLYIITFVLAAAGLVLLVTRRSRQRRKDTDSR